ncbi:MAG TPA: dienelactone hydrolase family protein [Rhizomicrobium sp.]|nr:dienelactone hydrolase family protein [Rhizomicrobium sp.]
MRNTDISYEAGGKMLTGTYMVDDKRAGKRPGILVCHQGGGLRDHEKERARMLAELGYAAFAYDVYGEVAQSREQAMDLLNGLVAAPNLWRTRMLAGLAQLKAQSEVDTSRLAAIGFCFGGASVLELTRITADLACVVSFHPGLTGLPETDGRPVHGKVVVCAGEKDPLIPMAARERFISLMKAAKADWQLLVYGSAGHSFTDASVDASGIPNFFYDAATDKRSWAVMRRMFEECFGAV